jgi:arylsulfatase A-like enzyme
MQPSRREFLALAAAGTAAAVAPRLDSPTSTEGQPNVVFLFSDDHSVPDLGCYGNAAIRTPHLDQLAREGMRFDRAYVTSPQCSPSRASILTGRTPHAVGASRLHMNAYPETQNVPSLLKDAGYFTAALGKVHQGHIQRDFDFTAKQSADFDAFFDALPEGKPFFLWMGSIDPHRDYAPGAVDPPHDPAAVEVPSFLPDTPEVRQDLALYYDEITRFDGDCGRLLEMLEERGLAENTMVVMAGDNGMPFPRAKATLYEPGINVPLLVRWPGKVSADSTSKALVSLMDLAATWLDTAGARVPDSMEAKSLVPLLTGKTESHRDHICCERNWHDNWDPIRSVVTDRYKLIQNYRPELGYLPSLDLLRSPSFQSIRQLARDGALQPPLDWYLAKTKPQTELYDLDADPGEWHNLAGEPEHAKMVKELQKVLGRWMNDTHDFLPPPAAAYPGEREDTLDGSASAWLTP